jgi:lysozyme family protein
MPTPSPFDQFIERVLGHEGGYVNDPRDPGGETNWGIAKRSYPFLDIRTLSRPAAIEIYRRDFWQAIGADKFHPAIGFQLLDAAVNHGPGAAARWLQRAVGVADDGMVGPVTRKAVQAADPADVVARLLAERLDFYTRLSTWPVYGRGWARRLAGNLRFAAADT